MSRKCIAIAVLSVLALATGGCPLLMVGSLGYEGYQYEKTGTLPGMPQQGSSGGNSTPASRSTPSAQDIE